MLKIRGRFVEVYSSKIDANDFQNLTSQGLDSDHVYDRLDEMDLLVGGIASYDFKIWVNDVCVVESIDQLNNLSIVRRREDIDLRKGAKGDDHFFAIIEHSKIRVDDADSAFKIEDIKFETQRVLFDDQSELTLIFPFHRDLLIDVSEDIELEAFTGVLISKEYGFRQFDIE
jgi:hypothetical protein